MSSSRRNRSAGRGPPPAEDLVEASGGYARKVVYAIRVVALKHLDFYNRVLPQGQNINIAENPWAIQLSTRDDKTVTLCMRNIESLPNAIGTFEYSEGGFDIPWDTVRSWEFALRKNITVKQVLDCVNEIICVKEFKFDAGGCGHRQWALALIDTFDKFFLNPLAYTEIRALMQRAYRAGGQASAEGYPIENLDASAGHFPKVWRPTVRFSAEICSK